MYYNAAMATNNPLSVRLSEAQRSELEALGAKSASEALQGGLERLVRLRVLKHQPLYPTMTDEPQVVDAIEAAASAACAALSKLFPEGHRAETQGISSNFQGLLVEHLTAMLTGAEAADRSWRTELNALFATARSFGRLPEGQAPPNVGYTVVKMAAQVDQVDLFLDPDRGYCELSRLQPGGLYTSEDACVRGVVGRMARLEVSPREEDVRLCAIEITDHGPLKVHAVACLASEPALSAADYAKRTAQKRRLAGAADGSEA